MWHSQCLIRFKRWWNELSPITSWIMFGSLIPFVIAIVLSFLVFDNPINALITMYGLRGKPSVTSDAFGSLSDILTLLITTYGILLTALFSYLVYIVSKQGVQISEKIRTLEEKRDSDNLCEQALIVYYEFQRNIVHLRDLYIDGLSTDEIKAILKQFHFSEDWVRNIATLRPGLTINELEKLYEVYNEFHLLQKLLESNAPLVDIKAHVDQLSTKLFIRLFSLPLLKELRSLPAEHIVNPEFSVILHKIYRMTFSTSQITESHQNGEFTVSLNGILHEKRHHKITTLYTNSGLEKITLYDSESNYFPRSIFGYNHKDEVIYIIDNLDPPHQDSLQIVVKDERNTSSDITIKYETHYIDAISRDGKIIDGVTTLFDEQGRIGYRGYVNQQGLATEGIRYNENTGEIVFRGTYLNNQRLEGELYKDNELIFTGTFNENKPWNGTANNFSFKSSHCLSFSGRIKDGKPFEGRGFRFKENYRGDTYDKYIYFDNLYESLQIQANEEGNPFDSDAETDRLYNALLREQYTEWADYIAAEWTNGEACLMPDSAENIKVVKEK